MSLGAASQTETSSAALAIGARLAVFLSKEGEVLELSHDEAAQRLAKWRTPVVLCHKAATAARLGAKLGISDFLVFDVLELFAFVRPAVFCLPTPRGLAAALGLALPGTLAKEASVLFAATGVLLDELALLEGKAQAQARAIAFAMAPVWPWGAAVLDALGASGGAGGGASGDSPAARFSGLQIWRRLKEWDEIPPPPPPGCEAVDQKAAQEMLAKLLGAGAEERPEQAAYAAQAALAFAPRDQIDQPRLVLAEAGTGVGKTLGYIAPASLWAGMNKGCVWISTFTRNLQRQLDGELDRLYPDPLKKAQNAVVRKGRENYFCLLNYEEAVNRLASGMPCLDGVNAVSLGISARWALASLDGDMAWGDFPAWLTSLFGRSLIINLTDTRGECVYAACPHYRKCFVERSIRLARHARIVIANHALTMMQAALGASSEDDLPSRYVFDEGHQIFAAADAAFSASLSGAEAAELRRWVLGAEDLARSRSRGLKSRIGDLVEGEKEAAPALQETRRAAHALPAPGWRQRLALDAPLGPAEAFLLLVRRQVYARDPGAKEPYSLETSCQPPVPGLIEAAHDLRIALSALALPMRALARALGGLLDEKAAALDSNARQRIETARRGLERRLKQNIDVWMAMLDDLGGKTPLKFVDWLTVERSEGADTDAAMRRHWLDPALPFAMEVCRPAQGVLITSATLRDGGGDSSWDAALARTGAIHLASPAILSFTPSSFDYAGRTRVLVVNDVPRGDKAAVAAAYRELFLSSGGGALGIFTAVARLKDAHRRIAPGLEAAGILLLAQHVDEMDTGTLVDIFRAEEDSCLLGTDAVRDGVDVPGRSLRLIVFDRVPWPHRSLLHKARRQALGGRGGGGLHYDDMLARLKIKQAYGRLLRRAGDKGAFVMLDGQFPSRLAAAFPDGVQVERLGLAEAVRKIREFLADYAETL